MRSAIITPAKTDSSSVNPVKQSPVISHPNKIPLWTNALPIQFSLKVNTPGDKYEQEADRVAEKVMRMPETAPNIGVQRKTCSCGKPTGPDGMCEDCKRKQLGIQRMAIGDGGQTAAPPIVNQVLSQPGRPLDNGTRHFMENRFGQDFSQIRVHVGGNASNSANAISAQAYTAGHNVVFGSGQYRPQTPTGRKLLAHELTHVLQQRAQSNTRIMRQPDPAKKEKPKEKQEPKAPQQTCPEPKGPGVHPAEVSQTWVDRVMGKYETIDLDHGEGCKELPYVAGKTESVCTIGYGHQIPGCTVLSRATGEPPTAEEIQKARPSQPPEFRCACEGTKHFDCKGPQGEQQVRSDAQGAAKHVNKVVPVDLDQAQFDALVDLTLHKGSLPPEFLTVIKKYWCTDEGKNYVREVYLRTALQPFPEAFTARRRYRVWPAASANKKPPEKTHSTGSDRPKVCLALDSMKRSADGICRLAGEEDSRCKDARAKVAENEKKLKGKCD